MKDNIFDIFCPFCGAELEETLIPQANEFEKLKAEVESLKAENTRLTAYDGGLALMPFEEWQTLSAETRARINTYGLQMETLQKERKWIPVTERLPEGHVDVLARLDGNTQKMFMNGAGDWLFASNCVRPGGKVTHWQPLPEPPQEQS